MGLSDLFLTKEGVWWCFLFFFFELDSTCPINIAITNASFLYNPFHQQTSKCMQKRKDQCQDEKTNIKIVIFTF